MQSNHSLVWKGTMREDIKINGNYLGNLTEQIQQNEKWLFAPLECIHNSPAGFDFQINDTIKTNYHLDTLLLFKYELL